MAISDTKLRTIYGKPYSGPQEVADADGLSVRISPKGVIQFQYRYRWHGKPNRLGLGRYPSLSLKDARQITADLRKLYFSGTDPRTYFEEKVENSMTVAQSRTASIRPRTRPAVSGFVDHIGSKAAITARRSTSQTGQSPKCGEA